MKEGYRPLTERDKRMHKLATEPWAYEYKIPLPQQEAPVETEKSAAGMFLVALLKAFIDVPESEGRVPVACG